MTARPAVDVVRDAAVEVRKPTMFGELIIMIVYLPILTLEGIEGKLFRPMALTVIFALVGSMILSLTLMPVLAPRSASAMSERPTRLIRLRAIVTGLLRSASPSRAALWLVGRLVLAGAASPPAWAPSSCRA